ncbi:MAG: dihydroorotase [Schleiferiaceae bacterium]|jgi:dihydroorotase|nr:dihydroorotase [Flavobacteriia bacterium]NDA07198.1 dihydroorotase [Flavobacteriia bacterium]NDA28265.1 dihydroorotase [Flavobacteriia bacterium]NDD20014.1 dihydroorotase [Flavobacteriia bacterium]NDD79743.1 dihydroorotase [Flavobacteriia bacterium]
MKILLPHVLIMDPRSPHHGQTVDLLLEDGSIVAIGDTLDARGATVLESARGRLVSPGWVDGRARSGEPGHEERETYTSLAHAASHGGFTHVAVMPSTTPARDSRPHVEALHQATGSLPVEFLPIGAVSKGLQGEQMAEMLDMLEGGAVAFSDDTHSISNPHLLQLALQYSADLPTHVQSFAYERHLCPSGQAHEGVVALSQGLSPIPTLAESLRIQRDVMIQEYAGGHLHIAGVSSAEGVEAIRAAKARGQQISADVAIANLIGTEEDIRGFDSTYKVLPPLRSSEDREALWEGFMDGTLDLVVSDHQPMDTEAKDCEWGQALFGAATIEHTFGWYRHLYPSHEALERWIEAVAHRARELYHLGTCEIKVGMPADLTVFALDGSAEGLATKGVNVPSWTQNGRAVGTILGSHITGLA